MKITYIVRQPLKFFKLRIQLKFGQKKSFPGKKGAWSKFRNPPKIGAEKEILSDFRAKFAIVKIQEHSKIQAQNKLSYFRAKIIFWVLVFRFLQ